MIFRIRWRNMRFAIRMVALSLLLAVGAAQAMTPAATRIENRAQATYPWEGEVRTIWSNWVTVTVLQVAAVDVIPTSTGGRPGDAEFAPAYRQSVTPGQKVYLPFRVTNAGNGPDIFQLDLEIESDSFAPNDFGAELYHDLLGDGLVDAGDPKVGQIALGAGESAALIAVLYIAGSASGDDEIHIALTATSTVDPAVRELDTWVQLNIATEAPIITASRAIGFSRGPYWPPGAPTSGGGSGTYAAEKDDRATHTITLDNMGYATGADILVQDALGASEVLVEDAYGVGFPLRVNGIPTPLSELTGAPAKLVTNPDGIRSIELLLPQMVSTQRVIVEYQTTIDWQVGERAFDKQALVSYEERPGAEKVSRSNTIRVLQGRQIAVRITPRGGSLAYDAPNLTAVSEAVAGQKVPFEVTVHNTGRTGGVIELETLSAGFPEGWKVVYYDADGATALVDTNNNGSVDLGYVAAGGTRDLVVVVEVPVEPWHFEDPPYQFGVEARFDATPEHFDVTYLAIQSVKSVEHAWDPLYLEVYPPGVTTPGTELQYSLYFANASNTDAFNVVIVEQLSPYLSPPIGMDGDIMPRDDLPEPGTRSTGPQVVPMSFVMLDALNVTGVYHPDQHAIVWHIPHVGPHEGGILSFISSVGDDTPESGIIEVQAVLTSDITTLVAVSNIVSNVVLTKEVLVSVTSQFPVIDLGDRNAFTVEVKNMNPLAEVHDVEVQVALPAGLSYRSGTSTLGGAAMADPLREPGMLIYTVPHIEKGSSAWIVFDTVLNAAAEHEIVVEARAIRQTGPDEWNVSPVSSVRVFVIHGIFSDQSLILGRVLVARVSEGETPAPPEPVAGVRVVMDNGAYAVSDQEGRFSFPSVRPGTRLFRLDPATLRTAGGIVESPDTAQTSVKRVTAPAGGIAMVDFVLHATGAEITSSERVIEGADD